MSSAFLVYLACGDRYIRQALYSIASIAVSHPFHRPKFVIRVYTDEPERFKPLAGVIPLETVHFSKSEMADWAGPYHFTLRGKIKVVQKELESGSDVLLIDADTICLGNLNPSFRRLRNGRLLMHRKEFSLSYVRSRHPEVCPDDHMIPVSSGRCYRVNSAASMWNSGVVGIPHNRAEIIEDVLEFMDKWFPMHPSRLAEQLSFSVVMTQQERPLGKCSSNIYHYWDSKELFDLYSSRFFSALARKSVQEALRVCRWTRFLMPIPMFLTHHNRELRLAASKKPVLYQPYKRVKNLVAAPWQRR